MPATEDKLQQAINQLAHAIAIIDTMRGDEYDMRLRQRLLEANDSAHDAWRALDKIRSGE